MPDPPDAISEQVQRMIGQMVAGDQRLRRESAERLWSANHLPTLWISRRISGKLCLVRMLNEQHFSLFGLFGKKDRSEVVADLRVRFAFEPALEPPPPPTELPAEYVPPGFVLPSDKSRTLLLQLAEGRTVEFPFDEQGTLELSVLKAFLDNAENLRLLLGMFVEWRKVAEWPSGPAFPLQFDETPRGFSVADFADLPSFATKLKAGLALKQGSSAADRFLAGKLSNTTQSALSKYKEAAPVPKPLQDLLVQDLNRIIGDASPYDLGLDTDTPSKFLDEGLRRINRKLIENAYPAEFATAVGMLLREAREQVRKVLGVFQEGADLWKQHAPQEAALSCVHPHLGGSYRLTQLEALALLQLDGNGKLISKKNAKDWHQVDVQMRVLLDQDSPALRISHLVPDILTKASEYHREFARALEDKSKELAEATVPFQATANGNAADEMAYKKSKGARTELLVPFFDSAQVRERVVFFRIAASQEIDTDLIWFRGEIWNRNVDLFFAADFEVSSYPAVHVRTARNIRSLDIVVSVKDPTKDEDPTKEWVRSDKARKLLSDYFRRQFTTLYQWQKLT